MTGLLLKAWREVWLSTLVFALAVLLVTTLLTYVLPQFYEGMPDLVGQIPFIQEFISALLGTDIGEGFSLQLMLAVVWVHPIVLSLFWAHEIILCTRMPAGEVDRGTIDVLLGLPVTRRAVYLAETIVWAATGILLCCMSLVGCLLGSRLSGQPPPPLARVVVILFNLWSLYLAVGGAALLVSALSDRRARAIGIVFALVLASFLLNFLAVYWDVAERVVFLSVLDHYRPADILRDGRFPTANVAVLLGTGLAAWVAGAIVVSRRSICTV